MRFLRIASVVNKHQLLRTGILSMAVVAGNNIILPSHRAIASTTTSFVCGKSDGKPATVARTKKGDVPIVVWSSEGFSESGFTPQVRCQQVSARFQSMYRTGQLKYITAGIINKLPVVCATKRIDSTCDRQNILYTLKPNTDPQQVIKRLMAIRNRSTARSLEEGAAIPRTSNVTAIEIDWLIDGDAASGNF